MHSTRETSVRPRSASSSLLECAVELEHSGQLQAALSAFQAASLCDSFPAGRLALAGFLIRREQFSSAGSELQQVLSDVHGNTGIPDGERRSIVAAATHNLAIVSRQTGDHWKASTLQQQSLKNELENEGAATPQDLTGCALDAIHGGDYSRAEALLLRSLELETRARNRTGIAADCGNLGVLAGLRGNLAVGIRFLGRASRIHRELRDDLATGTDYLNLGEIVQTAGRWSLAERCLTRAAAYFEKSAAPASLRKARTRLLEVQRLRKIRERDPLLN